MIQGTASNAGKSFICTGLCRILKQDGWRVAPFKSQNMALNSGVTQDGKEIGRAQIMQAEAAGLQPSVHMNPVLLKPTGETGSQVIVNGKPLGTMTAREYFSFRKKLLPTIKESFNILAAEHDIIIVEGAGSPAEINLQQDDIVNMGLAEMLNAPVLITGDIDRGGVFASLYGTAALVQPEHRRRIKGFIINRFRGDKTLLGSGPAQLEQLSGIPVVGIIPYIPIALDDEDSMAQRLSPSKTKQDYRLCIAVIALPHISNFTDFNPLEQWHDTVIRYIVSPEELEKADLIIIPGTKNTIDDLRWLRSKGLAAAIQKKTAAGIPCIGICGGFQILGREITDQTGAEQPQQVSEQGLGLLDHTTIFSTDKRTAQAEGILPNYTGIFKPMSALPYSGYEIHMGVSIKTDSGEPVLFMQGQKNNTHIFGTYLHGLFDSVQINTALHTLLINHKYPQQVLQHTDDTVIDYHIFKEHQYDKLAAVLRSSLDMEYIYHIIENGI